MSFRRPTDEEAAAGFAELCRLPIACWVTASSFAPPSYCCGGFEEGVAESYVMDYLEELDRRNAHPVRGDRVFDVEVRHEKLEEWAAIRVTVEVRVEVRAELVSEIPA